MGIAVFMTQYCHLGSLGRSLINPHSCFAVWKEIGLETFYLCFHLSLSKAKEVYNKGLTSSRESRLSIAAKLKPERVSQSPNSQSDREENG